MRRANISRLSPWSRLIRAESLPLFYDCCVRLEILSIGAVTVPYKLNSCSWTAGFLQSTPAHLFGRIKSLQLNFNNLDCYVEIDLRDRDDPISKVIIYRSWYSQYPRQITEASEANRQHLVTALRTLTTGIAARPGPLKLRLSDVEDMGEMVRSTFMDGTVTQ